MEIRPWLPDAALSGKDRLAPPPVMAYGGHKFEIPTNKEKLKSQLVATLDVIHALEHKMLKAPDEASKTKLKGEIAAQKEIKKSLEKRIQAPHLASDFGFIGRACKAIFTSIGETFNSWSKSFTLQNPSAKSQFLDLQKKFDKVFGDSVFNFKLDNFEVRATRGGVPLSYDDLVEFAQGEVAELEDLLATCKEQLGEEIHEEAGAVEASPKETRLSPRSALLRTDIIEIEGKLQEAKTLHKHLAAFKRTGNVKMGVKDCKNWAFTSDIKFTLDSKSPFSLFKKVVEQAFPGQKVEVIQEKGKGNVVFVKIDGKEISLPQLKKMAALNGNEPLSTLLAQNHKEYYSTKQKIGLIALPAIWLLKTLNFSGVAVSMQEEKGRTTLSNVPAKMVRAIKGVGPKSEFTFEEIKNQIETGFGGRLVVGDASRIPGLKTNFIIRDKATGQELSTKELREMVIPERMKISEENRKLLSAQRKSGDLSIQNQVAANDAKLEALDELLKGFTSGTLISYASNLEEMEILAVRTLTLFTNVLKGIYHGTSAAVSALTSIDEYKIKHYAKGDPAKEELFREAFHLKELIGSNQSFPEECEKLLAKGDEKDKKIIREILYPIDNELLEKAMEERDLQSVEYMLKQKMFNLSPNVMDLFSEMTAESPEQRHEFLKLMFMNCESPNSREMLVDYLMKEGDAEVPEKMILDLLKSDQELGGMKNTVLLMAAKIGSDTLLKEAFGITPADDHHAIAEKMESYIDLPSPGGASLLNYAKTGSNAKFVLGVALAIRNKQNEVVTLKQAAGEYKAGDKILLRDLKAIKLNELKERPTKEKIEELTSVFPEYAYFFTAAARDEASGFWNLDKLSWAIDRELKNLTVDPFFAEDREGNFPLLGISSGLGADMDAIIEAEQRAKGYNQKVICFSSATQFYNILNTPRYHYVLATTLFFKYLGCATALAALKLIPGGSTATLSFQMEFIKQCLFQSPIIVGISVGAAGGWYTQKSLVGKFFAKIEGHNDDLTQFEAYYPQKPSVAQDIQPKVVDFEGKELEKSDKVTSQLSEALSNKDAVGLIERTYNGLSKIKREGIKGLFSSTVAPPSEAKPLTIGRVKAGIKALPKTVVSKMWQGIKGTPMALVNVTVGAIRWTKSDFEFVAHGYRGLKLRGWETIKKNLDESKMQDPSLRGFINRVVTRNIQEHRDIQTATEISKLMRNNKTTEARKLLHALNKLEPKHNLSEEARDLLLLGIEEMNRYPGDSRKQIMGECFHLFTDSASLEAVIDLQLAAGEPGGKAVAQFLDEQADKWNSSPNPPPPEQFGAALLGAAKLGNQAIYDKLLKNEAGVSTFNAAGGWRTAGGEETSIIHATMLGKIAKSNSARAELAKRVYQNIVEGERSAQNINPLIEIKGPANIFDIERSGQKLLDVLSVEKAAALDKKLRLNPEMPGSFSFLLEVLHGKHKEEWDHELAVVGPFKLVINLIAGARAEGWAGMAGGLAGGPMGAFLLEAAATVGIETMVLIIGFGFAFLAGRGLSELSAEMHELIRGFDSSPSQLGTEREAIIARLKGIVQADRNEVGQDPEMKKKIEALSTGDEQLKRQELTIEGIDLAIQIARQREKTHLLDKLEKLKKLLRDKGDFSVDDVQSAMIQAALEPRVVEIIQTPLLDYLRGGPEPLMPQL